MVSFDILFIYPLLRSIKYTMSTAMFGFIHQWWWVCKSRWHKSQCHLMWDTTISHGNNHSSHFCWNNTVHTIWTNNDDYTINIRKLVTSFEEINKSQICSVSNSMQTTNGLHGNRKVSESNECRRWSVRLSAWADWIS